MAYNTYNNQQSSQQPQGQTNDIPLGWEDVLDGDDADSYKLLPEGDYYFTVKSFTRGRYEGGEKIPPCNKAVLTLSLKSAWTPTPDKPAAEGETTVNLLIVKSMRWKLSQFFIAIGYLKPGEEKAMNWNIVPGSTGTCAVTFREWTGNDSKKIRATMSPGSMTPRNLLCLLLLLSHPPPHSMLRLRLSPTRPPQLPPPPPPPLPGVRASNRRCSSPSSPPTPGSLVISDGPAALSERGPDRCRA